MSGGSSVVFWNQSNRKPAFFRGSIVETTRPIRSERDPPAMAMGPHAEARARRRHDDPLWVQRGEPGRVGFRRVRVRQHHIRGQDVLRQELHEAVPVVVREGPGHDHGAEVVQDADLVGKGPLAGSPRAVQANAIRRGRPERSALTPPELRTPMFEILVLRPIEMPREQQLLVFIEEPDRHVCGQCQRQSSRVARDAREPGLGEAVGIDIDAGAGQRPRCDRRRKTHVKPPFSGRASGPGSWRETIPFPWMTHRSWQTGFLSTCHVLDYIQSARFA